ncbi:HlyD family secretion protein [Ferruginibacter yonginensis]|uniref:HlyD family secretion protein n=1 Tax=Ferruginibacter yonginensis TaxID=1310416 RepID=A0ABV8QUH5_9BACT
MQQHKYLFKNLDTPEPIAEQNAFKNIYKIGAPSKRRWWRWAIFITLIVVLALPWTQNIRAKGNVTTIMQEQRPQEINTIIPGKIVKWYVKEGDFVKAGDTILQMGEIKVEYFDPALIQRTQQQIEAKKMSAAAYENKATTATVQTSVLSQGNSLKQASINNKFQQQQLKVKNDSIDVIAVTNELMVYKRQLDAGKNMLDSGAISLVDFEKRRINYQNGFAKKVGAENKLLQSKQELLNLQIEKGVIEMEYADKISKANGEKFGSLSNAASTQADISKLENILSNYDARNKLYYITAPQSGQITKAKKAGIGELLKEGEMITEIVPDHFDYAVEMYVEPMDLPLINKGQKVRFVFDGIPAIVFSGWPQNSFGTFGGVITAIESNVSTNGKFRVLVTEDKKDKPWPKSLKMGSGAQGIALLKDVPIIYELWRNINGFPPEFYTVQKEKPKK